MDRQQYPHQQYLPPGPFTPPPTGPPARPPRRRTGRLWLVIATVAVVIAAGVVVPLVLLHHSRGVAAAAASAPRTASSSPAPAAQQGLLLDISPGPATIGPRIWGSTPMYDACALMPLRTVLAQGITLDSADSLFTDNPEPGNSGGTGITQPNTVSHGSSSCFYPGLHLADSVSLTIYQQPFVTADTIQQNLETDTLDTTAQTLDGYTIYTDHRNDKPTQWLLAITDQQILAELDVTLTNSTYRGQSAPTVTTALAIAVIDGLRQPPGPAAQLRYAAPYTRVNPCGIFTEADFQQAFGQPDDQHPHAEFQLGERELDPDPGSSDPIGHYVDTQCQRFSVPLDQGNSTAPGIRAEFDTYRTTAQAEVAMNGMCTTNPDPTKDRLDHHYGPPIPATRTIPATATLPSHTVPVIVGDGPSCYPREKPGDWLLTFRAGRTVGSVWLWMTIDESKLDQLTPVVAPLAQALASKLASL